jgi:hypothetical protein
VFLVDWAALFAPTEAEILSAITHLLPIALGLFAVILGIRVGVYILESFLDDGDDADDEAA